jgi:hypothetical protein
MSPRCIERASPRPRPGPKVVRPDEASRIQLYDVIFNYGIGADDTDGRAAAGCLMDVIVAGTLVIWTGPVQHSAEVPVSQR